MKPAVLTLSDFEQAAAELDCEVAAIQAVCEVEAPHGGFLDDGRPTILFERHKFHQFTRGQFSGLHPDISNKQRGGYLGGKAEWKRYDRAFELAPHAAMMSTSWGRFQLMGFNYVHFGYPNVADFVAAMRISEREQLAAFVTFLQETGLDGPLRQHDWRRFAFGYNGPAQKDYDKRIARVFQRLSAEVVPLDAPTVAPVAHNEQWDAIDIPTVSEETLPYRPPARSSVPSSVPAELPAPPYQASRNSGKAWYSMIFSWIVGMLGTVAGFFERNPAILYGAIALILIAVLLASIRWIVLDAIRIQVAADPSKHNTK